MNTSAKTSPADEVKVHSPDGSVANEAANDIGAVDPKGESSAVKGKRSVPQKSGVGDRLRARAVKLRSTALKNNVPVAVAKSASLKGSMYKANVVANLVRGLAAAKAKTQLKFSNKSLARDLLKTINAALANAENNMGLDIDAMYVSQILVGKSFVLKRHEPRARGRAGIRRKRYFKYTVLLSSKI